MGLRTSDTMAAADRRTTPREVLREHRATILSLLSETTREATSICS